MNKSDKIYIAGHNGMVGSSILRLLQKQGFTNLIYKTSSELDLRSQSEVDRFFFDHRPNYVFLCAAKVGGIVANSTYKADFLYDNLSITKNIINSSKNYNVKKLLNLGSSCIYPKMCDQPIKEEYLLTGPLEPTNEPYALAKIIGIKLCDTYREQYGCNFISGMPTNLYGPNDNYHPENSHVLPSLIKKFHDAKLNSIDSVECWGDGSPMREFLHVDDLASACLFLMENYNKSGCINIGTGKDISIKDLSNLVCDIVGYKGTIEWDQTKPNGTPRKLLDITKIEDLGWSPSISLKNGIKSTYESFKIQYLEETLRS